MRDAWLRSTPLGPGLAGAAALWLSFPNGWISLPPLALLLPLCLALLGTSAPSAGAALRRGWLTSIAGMAAVLYWLTIPMATVGNLPLALAAVCALLVATCLASAGGLFCLLAHALRGRGPLAQAWLLGLAWYFLEYAYALVAGFPWLPLGGALAAWPLWIQAADVTGAYLLAGLWVTVILCLRHWRRPACAGTGLLLAVLLLGYGAWRLHTTPLESDPRGGDSVAVLFAEGNIDQNQKWVPVYQRRTVETYLRLTRAELARHPGETPLIVWPETALPFNFDNNGILSALVRNLARQARSPLLTGVPGFQHDAAGNMQVFNRALLLDPSGGTAGHYDKEHLVPFGEYVPEWLNWNFLADLLQEVGVYTPGHSAAPLVHGDLRLGMLICYEAIFPWLAQARVEHGANVLVDISNDGWFGRSPAALQHLYLASLRAVEQGRWLLRGTNTGISAIIDARGRVTVRGGQFEEDALWGRFRLQQGATVYHTLGPWLPLAAGLLWLGIFWGTRRPSP
ncbi:apolipoprotein N-acyltransferase, partial [Desulfovibrio piger]